MEHPVVPPLHVLYEVASPHGDVTVIGLVAGIGFTLEHNQAPVDHSPCYLVQGANDFLVWLGSQPQGAVVCFFQVADTIVVGGAEKAQPVAHAVRDQRADDKPLTPVMQLEIVQRCERVTQWPVL